MTSPDAAPYESLARMIERELELICTHDQDALATLRAERDRGGEARLAARRETP